MVVDATLLIINVVNGLSLPLVAALFFEPVTIGFMIATDDRIAWIAYRCTQDESVVGMR